MEGKKLQPLPSFCAVLLSTFSLHRFNPSFLNRELIGIRTFSLLLKSVGVFGVRGLDKLLCFMIVKELQQFIEKTRTETKQQNLPAFFKALEDTLSPPSTIPANVPKIYQEGVSRPGKVRHLSCLTLSQVISVFLFNHKFALSLALALLHASDQ
jgi:WASH complex subunit strumpellin